MIPKKFFKCPKQQGVLAMKKLTSKRAAKEDNDRESSSLAKKNSPPFLTFTLWLAFRFVPCLELRDHFPSYVDSVVCVPSLLKHHFVSKKNTEYRPRVQGRAAIGPFLQGRLTSAAATTTLPSQTVCSAANLSFPDSSEFCE